MRSSMLSINVHVIYFLTFKPLLRERDSVSTWGKYIRVVIIYNFRTVCEFNQSRISDLFRSVYVQWRDHELPRWETHRTPRINVCVTCYAFDEVLHLETRHLFLLSTNMADLKVLSYEAIFDDRSPMSGRVGSLIIYVVIRAAEIIDWWFPVKVKTP